MAAPTPAPRLTVDAVAEDETFLALVEQALVRVAHEVLLVPPVDDAAEQEAWRVGKTHTLPIPYRFAAWVALYARTYRHAAALAVLMRDDAPDIPWDTVWLRAAVRDQWETLARAAIGSGLLSSQGGL
jgi:hypothetical protein